MPYLNLDPGYTTHIKTRRLVAKLGRGAELLPIKLWLHCAAHHPMDGVLDGYCIEEVEALIEWDGEVGKAVSALEQVGFLTSVVPICDLAADKPTRFSVNGWLEHQGHLKAAKKRAKNAAERRWNRLTEWEADAPSMPQACPKHAPSMPQACSKHAPSNAPSIPSVPSLPTVPSCTEKDETVVIRQEPEPGNLRGLAFESLARLMGGDMGSQDIALERYVDTLREQINGKPRWQVVDMAIGEAAKAGVTFGTVPQAVRYIKAIIERCIRQGVDPGEFTRDKPQKSSKPVVGVHK